MHGLLSIFSRAGRMLEGRGMRATCGRDDVVHGSIVLACSRSGLPEHVGRRWDRAGESIGARAVILLTAAASTAVIETGAIQALTESACEFQAGSGDGDSANDWLCAWCLSRVANEKDRHVWGEESEFRFRNPEGIWFHIITFSRVYGCREVGVPTLEHTWFPGHSWSYCVCGSCRMHLGWFYSGQGTFAGLIRDRIVRAATIVN